MVKEDAQAWKWLISALFSALQGACVCHLTTTMSPIGALTDKNTREWLSYLDDRAEGPAPDVKLKPFRELLKAIRKTDSAGDHHQDSRIDLSDADLKWLTDLYASIRNPLQHFDPKGWSIELSGISKAARLAAQIISDINDGGWAFRHHRNKRDLAKDIADLFNAAGQMEIQLEEMRLSREARFESPDY